MKKIRIATRKSALALAQTKIVSDRIMALGYEPEIVTVTTRGDRDRTSSLAQIGGDGLFIREIEERLIAGEADIAVHSAKDLPYELADGLIIGATPDMADAADCLVSTCDAQAVRVVGTSSPRRAEGMSMLYPDAVCRDIRGNVDTRIKKLRDGMYDAIVLAKAGLDRLQPDMEGLQVLVLPPTEMIPAPCQGILTVECRRDDDVMRELLLSIDDDDVRKRFETERRVLCGCRVDCSTPMGAYADYHGDSFDLYVTVNGKRRVYAGDSGDMDAVIACVVSDYEGGAS